MVRDDYFVITYRILAYLYACLKAGEEPKVAYLQPKTEVFPIIPGYWDYIIAHLYDDGYIDGKHMITPKGIEFLHNNSAMAKARDFLKTLKEPIPEL